MTFASMALGAAGTSVFGATCVCVVVQALSARNEIAVRRPFRIRIRIASPPFIVCAAFERLSHCRRGLGCRNSLSADQDSRSAQQTRILLDDEARRDVLHVSLKPALGFEALAERTGGKDVRHRRQI